MYWRFLRILLTDKRLQLNFGMCITPFNLVPPSNVYSPLPSTGMASPLGITIGFSKRFFVFFQGCWQHGWCVRWSPSQLPNHHHSPLYLSCKPLVWCHLWSHILFLQNAQEGHILANWKTWNRSRICSNACFFGFGLLSFSVSKPPLEGILSFWSNLLESARPFHKRCSVHWHHWFGVFWSRIITMMVGISLTSSRHDGLKARRLYRGFLIGRYCSLSFVFYNKVIGIPKGGDQICFHIWVLMIEKSLSSPMRKS